IAQLTISKVSGDGQIQAQLFHITEPMVVAVRDSNGAGVPSVPVAWALSGSGFIDSAQTLTDANGQASNSFTGNVVLGGASYTQSTVTASLSNGANVSFTVTAYAVGRSGQAGAQAGLDFPTLADLPLTGAAGQKFPMPLRVHVSATSGVQSGGI